MQVTDTSRTVLPTIAAVAALLILLATPATAQTAFTEWQQVGPEGGPLAGLIVDPNDSTRWLALSGRGLFEKRDESAWLRIGTLPSGTGVLLAMEAGQPQRLLATSRGSSLAVSTTVWLSEDGGATWQDLVIPIGPTVDVVAMVSAPTGYLLATSQGLWRWQVDGGWTQLLDVRLIDFDLSEDGTLGIALSLPADGTGREVLRSGDGGLTWGAFGIGTGRTVESVSVTGLDYYAIGTNDDDGSRFTANRFEGPSVWVIVDSSGLPATSFISSLEVIDVEGLDILFSYRPPQTYRSFDFGRTWAPLDLDGTGSDKAVSVQRYDVTSRAQELIAYGPAGAFTSTDGGGFWRERNDGLFVHFIDEVAVDPVRPDELWTRASSGESFRSDDGGATWSRLPLALARGALLVQEGGVFVGAHNGWYRSGDGGESWQLQQVGAAGREHVVFDFSVDPTNPSRLVAGGTDQTAGAAAFRDAAHWWSEDGGITWTRGAELSGETAVDIYDVAHDPFQPVAVYLAGVGGVYRATDGGAAVEKLEGAGDFAWSIAADPFEPGRLLVRTPSELLRSVDSGASWLSLDNDPPFDQSSALRADARVRGRFWAESGAGLWRSDDAGESWQLATEAFPDLVNTFDFDPSFPRTVYAGAWRNGLLRLILADGLGCDHPQLLCLGDERFVLESRWRDFEGREGVGQKGDLTADTGYFWFFDPANVELVTKVLDGRGFNGNYWVFYGSLSNVEFGLKVTDTKSQQVVGYQNPSGNFASVGDTGAFPELLTVGFDGPGFDAPGFDLFNFDGPVPVHSSAEAPTPKVEGCEDLVDAICIGDRFRLSATWRDFDDRTGVGTPRDLTDDTVYFTFFSPTNVELMVKVLDGRGFNGRWWVFFASLSNVEFTLTVEDLETGAVRRYQNPIGNFASVGDTDAF